MGYVPSPPPRPNPAKNPSCYSDGRDCYEVEQEALALAKLLDGRPRIYQSVWWRLQWLLFKYYPLDISQIKAKYDRYFSEQYELQQARSVVE